MNPTDLSNWLILLSAVAGVGGVQFVVMYRYQRRQLISQANNAEVNSAAVMQGMALAMLEHKEAELVECESMRKELRHVIAGLIGYIKSIPELPPMPAELTRTVKGWM